MKEDFTDFIEVSGLLDYDPETISKIYKKNPKRLLKRGYFFYMEDLSCLYI